MVIEPSPEHLVWLDGSFLPWGAATMHVSAHHYGYGVFEGVRCYATAQGAAVFRLADHTARLFRSAHILNIEIPSKYPQRLLDDVQLELLRRNDLRDAYLRPFVFYGGTAGLSRNLRGLAVHVAVFALGWRSPAPRSIALRTASYTRAHPNSVLAKAKANGNYMNGMLALQEAESAGADEALLLDQHGFAAETSGSNLFIVRDGVLATPPLEAALDGITRDTVKHLAASFGWSLVERRITRDEIYIADEAFVTGTAAEITAVREIDGRKLRAGAPGPITQRLVSAYSELVRGAGPAGKSWSTSV